MSIIIIVFARAIAAVIGENFTTNFKIKNETKDPVPPTSRLRIKETPYNFSCSVKVGSISPYTESSSIQLTVQTKGGASIETLPSRSEYELFDENTGRVIATGTFTNDMFEFNAGLNRIKPPQHVRLLNVLLMGLPGTGKSSFISTCKMMMTSGLGDQGRLVTETAIKTGGSAEHSTTDFQGHKDVCSYLQFIDPWGLDARFEDPNTIDFMLDGKLPFGWEMDMNIAEFEEQFNQHSAYAKDRRIHAIMFLISIGDLNTEAPRNQMIEYFNRVKARGYNPMLMLARADEVYETLKDKPMDPPKELNDEMTNASRMFNIPRNCVSYIVNYNAETKRSFDTERLAYKNLHLALMSAREFATKHCSAKPTPTRRALDWGAPTSSNA